NAARTDEKRLAPGAVERGNVRSEGHDGGGQAIERSQMNRGEIENFAGFDLVRCRSTSHFRTDGTGFAHQTEHDLGAGLIGHNVGRAPAGERADVESGLAEK